LAYPQPDETPILACYAPFSRDSATARQWASNSAAPKSSASPEASRISENAVGGRTVRRPVSEFCSNVNRVLNFLARFCLDAVVGGGAQDALEQLLADAAASIGVVDRERRLRMDVAPEWRLLAPDRLIGAQFRGARHFAIDKRPVKEVALAEAVFGVADKKLIRHAAAEAHVPAARVKADEMVAKRFFIGQPKPSDFHEGRICLVHNQPRRFVLGASSQSHIVRCTIFSTRSTRGRVELEQGLAKHLAFRDRLERLLVIFQRICGVDVNA
jgi:hypothetical protein